MTAAEAYRRYARTLDPNDYVRYILARRREQA